MNVHPFFTAVGRPFVKQAGRLEKLLGIAESITPEALRRGASDLFSKATQVKSNVLSNTSDEALAAISRSAADTTKKTMTENIGEGLLDEAKKDVLQSGAPKEDLLQTSIPPALQI
jgi:hypothetical protein